MSQSQLAPCSVCLFLRTVFDYAYAYRTYAKCSIRIRMDIWQEQPSWFYVISYFVTLFSRYLRNLSWHTMTLPILMGIFWFSICSDYEFAEINTPSSTTIVQIWIVCIRIVDIWSFSKKIHMNKSFPLLPVECKHSWFGTQSNYHQRNRAEYPCGVVSFFGHRNLFAGEYCAYRSHQLSLKGFFCLIQKFMMLLLSGKLSHLNFRIF
jgi:hypothetical protein